MNRNMKFILLFGLVILLIGQVSALGITPGRTTIDFEPSLERTVEFSVINSEGKDMDLVVLITGDLNESIEVSEVSFHMGADEESKTLSYKINLPGSAGGLVAGNYGLVPGDHGVDISVIELPSKSKTSEAFVGAVVGVTTQVRVFVPYPDKYAEAGLNIIGGGAQETTFVIPVLNKGGVDLARVRATIDIFSSLNEKVDTLRTQEVGIEVKGRKELAAKWDKEGILPGPYRAVVTVIYDEETLQLEGEFNIGSADLEIEQIEVPNFRLGEIAKFESLIENKWSEKITNAYVQMNVFDQDSKILADFKSATYDVEPLSKSLLVSFWDTAGVKAGSYDADIILHYLKKEKTNKVQFEISNSALKVVGVGYVISSASNSGEGSNLTTILIVIIGILVLVNILWFLVLRKRLAK